MIQIGVVYCTLNTSENLKIKPARQWNSLTENKPETNEIFTRTSTNNSGCGLMNKTYTNLIKEKSISKMRSTEGSASIHIQRGLASRATTIYALMPWESRPVSYSHVKLECLTTSMVDVYLKLNSRNSVTLLCHNVS